MRTRSQTSHWPLRRQHSLHRCHPVSSVVARNVAEEDGSLGVPHVYASQRVTVPLLHQRHVPLMELTTGWVELGSTTAVRLDVLRIFAGGSGPMLSGAMRHPERTLSTTKPRTRSSLHPARLS